MFNALSKASVDKFLALIDALQEQGKILWTDIWDAKYGPAGDSILQIAGNCCLTSGDYSCQVLKQLMKKCIECDKKNVIFRKNKFGMNSIDTWMVIDTRYFYIDKSKYGKIFSNYLDDSEQKMIEESYKKATISCDLTNACSKSNFSKVETMWNEIDGAAAINMACLHGQQRCNVKCFVILLSGK